MMRKALAGILVILFAISSAWAVAPKRISCQKTGKHEGNTQCDYKVVGQKINDPTSVTKLYGMSNMPYALCSSAACKVDKNSPGLAECTCKVFGLNDKEAKWRKASVGPHTYSKSKAVKSKHKLVSVTSNFSFANINNKSQMTSRNCKFTKPANWANCFGVRCRINAGGKEVTATCNCPVAKTAEFVSMGPKSKGECGLPDGKVWSAATSQQGKNDFAVIQDMYKQYYPASPMIT